MGYRGVYGSPGFYYIVIVMMDQNAFFTAEARDMLNSHPAYSTSDQFSYINKQFFCEAGIGDQIDWGSADGKPGVVIRYHDCIRWKHGLRNGCFLECNRNTASIAPFSGAEAEEFLKWLDPLWCRWKGIETSGFFDDGLETFGEDDLMDI